MNMSARPSRYEIKQPERPKLRDVMGPGLISGASDDDPSGIATYSQAGAQFGYTLGWTLLLTYPLMCAIQLISAQIGRVTGRGLAGNIRRHYPAPLLYLVVGLLVVANTINLGADLGAMAAALHLLIDGPILIYVAGFAIVTVLAEVFIRYSRYASVLRWLTLSLFAYVATVFVVGVPWLTVARDLVLPDISLSGNYLTVVVAVFGTTISPYLFFWQAGEEVEDEKEDPEAKPLIQAPQQAPRQMARMQLDTLVGMGFSNIIALFIMLTTAATLNAHGVTDIQTSSQAAEALRPIAGSFTFTIFALGIIGTGLLAVPVLAGSAAYAVGEAMHWRVGLAQRPGRARLLRRDRGGDLSRRSAQLHPARSDQGAVLERCHQRGSSGPNHGHDHADGLTPGGDGPVHANTMAVGLGLARHRGDGDGGYRHVHDLGQLSARSSHERLCSALWTQSLSHGTSVRDREIRTGRDRQRN
jgi:NRAMP (natural resistance-associated macrophage protein)-like metal ion transporter